VTMASTHGKKSPRSFSTLKSAAREEAVLTWVRPAL
jgi:hypothetical protein